MALHVLPIIMAGGSSTRQWPFSRALYPKQLLALSGDQTLFQQTTQRLMDLTGNDIHVAPPCSAGNEEHRFMVLDPLRELGIEPGALRVAGRAQTKDVKLIVNALQKAKRSAGSLHRQVHRPWGRYDSSTTGRAFRSNVSWSNPAPA